ncbi:uncharacterized protein LOC144716990 isoform X2 [Wolffia australiana]
MESARSKLPDIPDWLPDGWIFKTIRRIDGRFNRTYVCPVTGRAFTSRGKVLDYLHFGIASAFNPDGPVSQKANSMEKMPEKSRPWLPNGWKIQDRKRGGTSVYSYKVLQYLSSEGRIFEYAEKRQKPDLNCADKQLCNSKSIGKRTASDCEDDACSSSLQFMVKCRQFSADQRASKKALCVAANTTATATTNAASGAAQRQCLILDISESGAAVPTGSDEIQKQLVIRRASKRLAGQIGNRV